MSFGFGKALDVLRAGDAVRRRSWQWPQDDPYLILVPGSIVPVSADRPVGSARPALVGEDMHYGDHIDMVRGLVNPYLAPWVATTADLLAEDWDYATPVTILDAEGNLRDDRGTILRFVR